MHPLLRPDVSAAMWIALRPLRDFHHRGAGTRHCPSAPSAAVGMLAGAPVPAACEPCYDLLVDAGQHLARRAAHLDVATDPPAYAAAATRRLAADRVRAANAELGGLSRPDRRTGVPGRIAHALRPGPDGGWYDTLLTLILAASCARAPVPTQVWSYESFAAAKAAHTGRTDPGVHAEIAGDVRAVLAIAEQVAGRDWVDAHVHAPLRGRGLMFAIGGTDREPQVLAGRPRDPAAAGLTASFWRRLPVNGDAVAAVAAAVADLGGPPQPRRRLAPVAVELIADLPRLSASATRGRHPGSTEVRAEVARRCGDGRVAAALAPDLVDAVVAALAAVPVDHLAVRRRPGAGPVRPRTDPTRVPVARRTAW